jgi:hypothetical protein
MPTKTWKSIEMMVARIFGSTRAPLSGGNGKQTRSDTLHPRAYIETKYGKQARWIKLFEETAVLAAREEKLPVVVLVAKGDRRPYILAPLDPVYLERLLKILQDAHQLLVVDPVDREET